MRNKNKKVIESKDLEKIKKTGDDDVSKKNMPNKINTRHYNGACYRLLTSPGQKFAGVHVQFSTKLWSDKKKFYQTINEVLNQGALDLLKKDPTGLLLMNNNNRQDEKSINNLKETLDENEVVVFVWLTFLFYGRGPISIQKTPCALFNYNAVFTALDNVDTEYRGSDIDYIASIDCYYDVGIVDSVDNSNEYSAPSSMSINSDSLKEFYKEYGSPDPIYKKKQEYGLGLFAGTYGIKDIHNINKEAVKEVRRIFNKMLLGTIPPVAWWKSYRMSNKWKHLKLVNTKKKKLTIMEYNSRTILNSNKKKKTLKYKITDKEVFKFYRHKYLKTKRKLSNNIYYIGVFDIETYEDEEKNLIPYHIGVLIENKKVQKEPIYEFFYLKDYKSADEMILCFLKFLMQKKHNRLKLYAHNLIGFDMKLIFNVAKVHYKMKPIMTTNSLLGWKIIDQEQLIEIVLKDSQKMIPGSLKNIARDFDVSTLKTEFPHLMATKERIYNDTYELPKKEHFYQITDEEYNKHVESLIEYNFRINSEKYLKNDLKALYECLLHFSEDIFKKYKVSIFNHYTLSGLTVAIFRSNYVNVPLNTDIMHITDMDKHINNSLRSDGYKGGIVDVYIPHGKNLYCYDVNSLYPHVMTDLYPTDSFHERIFYRGTPFKKKWNGVFWATVTCPENIKPFLAHKHNNVLTQPYGTFNGIFTSNELNYATELGYNIEVHKGLFFKRKKPIFHRFVDDLYSIKSNPNIKDSTKKIFKLLLNSLYGAMGARQDTNFTTVLHKDSEEFHKLINFYDKSSMIWLDDYVVVKITDAIETIPGPNESVRIATKISSSDNFSNVPIAMNITANARIHMYELRKYCDKNNINIYYTDTDSVFVDKKLPDDFLGSELGKLKLEYEIDEAYFIGPKIYALKLKNGEEVVKFKGIKTGSVNYDFIKNLYNNSTEEKYNELFKSNIDYIMDLYNQSTGEKDNENFSNNNNSLKSKAHFTIPQNRLQPINQYEGLKSITRIMEYNDFLYTKGEYVFDENGKWVKTKPFIIEEEEKEGD